MRISAAPRHVSFSWQILWSPFFCQLCQCWVAVAPRTENMKRDRQWAMETKILICKRPWIQNPKIAEPSSEETCAVANPKHVKSKRGPLGLHAGHSRHPSAPPFKQFPIFCVLLFFLLFVLCLDKVHEGQRNTKPIQRICPFAACARMPQPKVHHVGLPSHRPHWLWIGCWCCCIVDCFIALLGAVWRFQKVGWPTRRSLLSIWPMTTIAGPP